MNSCYKSFYIVIKIVCQLGTVGQLWPVSLITFHNNGMLAEIHANYNTLDLDLKNWVASRLFE